VLLLSALGVVPSHVVYEFPPLRYHFDQWLFFLFYFTGAAVIHVVLIFVKPFRLDDWGTYLASVSELTHGVQQGAVGNRPDVHGDVR